MWLSRAEQAIAAARRWQLLLGFGVLGALGSLGQAPFNASFISVVAFATVLFLIRNLEVRPAAWVGWAFGFGYFALCMQWLVSPFMVEPERHAWMAPFALIFMAGGLALFWAAAFVAARWARFSGAILLTLPLMELARAYLFTGFPWGMPAYGVVNTYFAQAAAWVGPHGLNLLFFVFAFAMSRILLERSVQRWGYVAISLVGLLALADGPDPMSAQPDAGVLRLVQPNAPQHQKWDPDFMPIFFDRALEFTAAPVVGGAGAPDLVLWPETSLPSTLNYADTVLADMVAASGGTPIVVGANRREDVRLMNAAVLIDGQGQVASIYDKHHLVPFGEYIPFGDKLAQFGIHGMAASAGQGFTAGPGAALMDLGKLGKALPLICYEVVFPQDVAAAPERPDFLMQITNDAWFGKRAGPFQHLAQAQMRSIEQGLPMVRVANTGISALIDARGRVVEALPLNQAGYLDVTLTQALPETLYAKTGDWPLGGVLILLYSALWFFRRRFRD